jgi:hypothetical protein
MGHGAREPPIFGVPDAPECLIPESPDAPKPLPLRCPTIPTHLSHRGP